MYLDVQENELLDKSHMDRSNMLPDNRHNLDLLEDYTFVEELLVS
jgi:hypothetical protein